MAAPVLERANGAASGSAGEEPQRRIDRRVPLPGGRAVAGGLLVTLAAVGVFAAWRTAGEEATRAVVVVAVDLRPGEIIEPGDLTVRHLELPAALADAAYADPARLEGGVALAPLAAGDLVQRSAVAEPGAAPDGATPTAEISFAVDADRAVDGRLRVGERVDVLATFGTGAEAATDVVVRGAVVLAGTRDDGGIGTRRLTITLGLDGDHEVLALTHAVRAGEVTVVRTTGRR